MNTETKKRGRKAIDPKEKLQTVPVPVKTWVLEAVGGKSQAAKILKSMAQNLLAPKTE